MKSSTHIKCNVSYDRRCGCFRLNSVPFFITVKKEVRAREGSACVADLVMEAPDAPPGCGSWPYDANVTLGPLGIDYLYLHYCVFAGLPLLSAAVLLSWLVVLFYFCAFLPCSVSMR